MILLIQNRQASYSNIIVKVIDKEDSEHQEIVSITEGSDFLSAEQIK